MKWSFRRSRAILPPEYVQLVFSLKPMSFQLGLPSKDSLRPFGAICRAERLDAYGGTHTREGCRGWRRVMGRLVDSVHRPLSAASSALGPIPAIPSLGRINGLKIFAPACSLDGGDVYLQKTIETQAIKTSSAIHPQDIFVPSSNPLPYPNFDSLYTDWHPPPCFITFRLSTSLSPSTRCRFTNLDRPWTFDEDGAC
ncbi:hypothetical protein K439DRAFT_1663366 [Ramaria rubella]|nr:hypothetical protein K439DRAFT_1663366 [Ramaria rubella]